MKKTMRANIAADVRMAELEYKLNHLLSSSSSSLPSFVSFQHLEILGTLSNREKSWEAMF